MELFDATIKTRKETQLPDDLLEALHTREITKAGMGVTREEAEKVHLSEVYWNNIQLILALKTV